MADCTSWRREARNSTRIKSKSFFQTKSKHKRTLVKQLRAIQQTVPTPPNVKTTLFNLVLRRKSKHKRTLVKQLRAIQQIVPTPPKIKTTISNFVYSSSQYFSYLSGHTCPAASLHFQSLDLCNLPTFIKERETQSESWWDKSWWELKDKGSTQKNFLNSEHALDKHEKTQTNSSQEIFDEVKIW